MMTIHPEHTTLRGGIKWVAITAWVVLVIFLVGTFAIGVPLRWDYLRGKTPDLPMMGVSPALQMGASRLGPEELQALESSGVTLEQYAAFILFFEVALALVCIGTALVIFLRRSNDWMALLFSLALVLLGWGSVSFVTVSLALIATGWVLVYTFASLLGMTTNLYLLVLSPDGWFVPRWTKRLVAGFTGFILAIGLYCLFSFETMVALPLFLFAILVWIPWIGLGIWSQILRYRHFSGPVQRQQTKWVVVGLAAISLGFAVNGVFNFIAFQQVGAIRLMALLARVSLTHLLMMALPICLAFSILRYRLWDIDVIIRRTLTYALVVGLLAVFYFGSVIFLQRIFASAVGDRSEVVTVLSTLAIAALFVPLRNWIQTVIDKRFNREKYNAQQVLTDFANTVRDETDLEKLTTRLMQVVDETMEPKTVSLWLKNTEDGRRRSER